MSVTKFFILQNKQYGYLIIRPYEQNLVFYYLFILLLFISPVGDMTQVSVYKEHFEQPQVAIF